MKRVCLFMTLVCMMMVSCDGKHEGHEYVDLGLSVKWATCNVGATSPEDYGHYFAWGETSPKDEYTDDNRSPYGFLEAVVKRVNDEYTDDNCSTFGKQMGDIAGDAQYDAATANWGGNWRMPTYDELKELFNNCTWTWTTQNGVNGYNVKGPSGNSIFLPAAGGRGELSFDFAGSDGVYWSSTPGDSIFTAYRLCFFSLSLSVSSRLREICASVRPVVE